METVSPRRTRIADSCALRELAARPSWPLWPRSALPCTAGPPSVTRTALTALPIGSVVVRIGDQSGPGVNVWPSVNSPAIR